MDKNNKKGADDKKSAEAAIQKLQSDNWELLMQSEQCKIKINENNQTLNALYQQLAPIEEK